jgi:transcriptional regulator with PAS, ATPase and Fis domain
MSPALQAKYLRMLRDGVAPRLGGKGELSVDVRVVAATNRDAAQAVQNRALHLLPPLRRRLEDLELLVDAFITEFNEKYERQAKSVDHATMARLREHGWPGNVRELIRRTLESVKNNKPRAAAILGTTPQDPSQQSPAVAVRGGRDGRELSRWAPCKLYTPSEGVTGRGGA